MRIVSVSKERNTVRLRGQKYGVLFELPILFFHAFFLSLKKTYSRVGFPSGGLDNLRGMT